MVISPGLDNPLDFFVIFKHNQGFTFTNPNDFPSNSPGQPFEFIDNEKGEKVLVDSHQGKINRFKFTY